MQPAEVSDAELVRRMRSGDQAAWSAFVQRYSRYVHAIATRAYRLDPARCRGRVPGSVRSRVYGSRPGCGSDEAVRRWIGQLTRRLCVDCYRASRREEARAAFDEATAEETIVRIDEALAVRMRSPR